MRFLKLGAVVFLLGLAVGGAHAAQNPFAAWRRLEMDDFSILSDASPKDVEEFAVTYAAFRQVMRERVVGANVKLPRSLIVLFRQEKTFREYAPDAKAPKNSRDRESHVTAFTSEVDGMALTALSVAGDREQALTTLFEFETIWMLRRVGVWVPIWASQGTGEVLSTLTLSKGRCRFGADDLRFIDPLRQSDQFPWPQFFSIRTDSPEYRGEKNPGVYHAQAWALMHWVLLSGEGGQQRFRQLAEQLKSGLALPAIEQVMGVTSKKLSSAVDAGMHISVWLPFDEKAVRASWRVLPVVEAEMHAQLADVFAAAGNSIAAEGELGRAQLLAPELPQVLEARARQARRKNYKDEAASLYRRAIDAGSTNPHAYLASAHARLDASGTGGVDYSGGGGLNVETALGEIRHALELAPGSVEIYEAMGRAFFIAPKITADDIAELSRGIGPGRIRVRHYRALLFKRLEKYDESIADFRAVIADPECPPQLRRASEQRVSNVIFNGQRRRAEGLVKAKQFAEARALLTTAKEENPDASDNYERLLNWIAGQERTAVFGEVREEVERLVAVKKFDDALASVTAAEVKTKNAVLAKDLARLRAWVEENTALQRLNELFFAKQWTEFHDRVQDFLKQYPKSNQASRLRQSDERALREQAANPP